MDPLTLGAAVILIAGIFLAPKGALGEAAAKIAPTLAPNFTRWDPLFQKYAATFKGTYPVHWKHLKAICMNESSLGAARSVAHGLTYPSDKEGSASTDKKSWGLMQTTLPTSGDMRPGTTFSDLNNPEISVMIGAKYFAWLMSRYRGDLFKAVISYNQGPGNTEKGVRSAAALEYWDRFNRNLAKIHEAQP